MENCEKELDIVDMYIRTTRLLECGDVDSCLSDSLFIAS